MTLPFEVEILEKDGKRLSEIWRLNNRFHAPTGQPAMREWDPKTGILIEERYFSHGELHRLEEDGPALQRWDGKTGKKTHESWWGAGHRHRDSGLPAKTNWDSKTGVATSEEYWCAGLQHRDSSLPAVIERDSRGRVLYIGYYKDGDLLEGTTATKNQPLFEPENPKALEP